MRIYDAMFEKAFNDPKVRNIALSGAYGSGKSSILHTRKEWDEKRRKSHKYLIVSLAHFQTSIDMPMTGDGGKVPGGETAEKIEEAIERGIFTQLVYDVPVRRVPLLRVARKSGWRWWQDALFAAVLVAAVVDAWLVSQAIADGVWSVGTTMQIVAVLLLLMLGTYVLIRRRPLSGIALSLNLGGHKVELAEAKDLSFFDRHLDDIIYLLRESGCDVVAFEDIDRFNDPRIFEKLREINSLVNESRGAGKWPIRFIYLVRDDLFSSKERTKFFDFIIPVIPYVDCSNAMSEMMKRLRDSGFNVSSRLLHGISLHINEARTLREAVNEAIQYKASLGGSFGGHWEPDDDERMLALAIYKVLFPADFARLQEGKGIAAWLLNQRERVVGTLSKEIELKIDKERQQIERMEEEHLRNERELTLLYSGEGAAWVYRGNGSMRLERASVNPDAISNFIDKISLGQDGTAERYRQAAEILVKNDDFSRRLEIIQERIGDGIEKARRRVVELERRRYALNNMSLPVLFQKGLIGGEYFNCAYPVEDAILLACGKSEFEEFLNGPDYPLVKFFISNGYIDLSYERYISEFREGSISIADRAYLKAVLSFGNTDENYEFDEPVDALSWLDVEEWKREGARNHSLVRALIENRDVDYTECATALFEGIHDDFDTRFLARHAAGGWVEAGFFEAMDRGWPEAVVSVMKDNLPIEDRRAFARSYLSYHGIGDAPKESLESVRDFASHDSRFLEPDERFPLSPENLQIIGYCAEELDAERADSSLLEWVFESGSFAPNVCMLELMLQRLCGYTGEELESKGIITCALCSSESVRESMLWSISVR